MMRSAHRYYQSVCPISGKAKVASRRIHIHYPSLLAYFYDKTIMEDFIADEVESILYIAREISGMPYSPTHDAPM